MNIYLYSSFYKKKNSTLQPSPGQGHTESELQVTGVLKEPCSVLSPVVSFQSFPSDTLPYNPCVYTYAWIPRFHRYYFIEDWVWNDGLWVAHMSIDVLATYKNVIGNTQEYILRTDSDSSNFNGAITDHMYPATTNFNIEEKALSNPFQTVYANGTYILGVISYEDDSIGAITYYAMDQNEFDDLKGILFSDNNLDIMGIIDTSTTPPTQLVTDISQEILKTVYNPYQYVVSCMWFPVTKNEIAGVNMSTIKLGWWSYSVTGKKLTQTTGSFNDGVDTIPVHPQASTRGKYLNYNPYTKVTLQGKFGSIPIDTAYIEIGNYLINTYLVDYITGKCLFEVHVADNASGTNRILITKTEFLIGVPIQIAQIGVDYIGTVSTAVNGGMGIVNAVGNSIGMGVVAGAVAGGLSALSAIGNTIESAMPQLNTSGSNGSFINKNLSTIIIAHHYIITDEDIHHKGRPLCEIRTINTLSGFVLCSEGDIDLDAFDNERKMVKDFLTTGFFWE